MFSELENKDQINFFIHNICILKKHNICNIKLFNVDAF